MNVLREMPKIRAVKFIGMFVLYQFNVYPSN